MSFLILILFLWIPLAAFTSFVADTKGWSRATWFLNGFFFGPLGLLAAVGLPDRPARQKLQQLIDIYTINL